MDQLIRDNISAVFALIGAFVGAALSFYGTWILQKRDAQTRLLEKVLDRRIAAHEKIIELVQAMRTTVDLGRFDKDGELARYPKMFTSKATFEEWMRHFGSVCGASSTWLSTELTRELNFYHDYQTDFYVYLRPVSSEKYPEVGAIVRDDFIDFAQRWEQLAFDFFARDLTKFKINDLRKWHKYSREETLKRFSATAYMERRAEITALIGLHQQMAE